MKKSNTNVGLFSQKNRQSYVAILLIIYKTYSIIVRQAWPFLIYFFVGGGDKKYHFLIGISVMAVLGMVWSIIKFFRYYFYIREDELIIEHGVFNKAKTNVPFDRVQMINFEQNLIHRIFNVVKLKVDTAGSAGNELEFQAIDHKTADHLRNILLSKKSELRIETKESSKETTAAYETIMSLDVPDLLKAGMVENHLRSGGLIMAGMYWIWQSADDIGMSDVVEGSVSKFQYGLMMIVMLAVVFVVISFIISLIRMLFKNYDLQFLRSDRGFKINAGLFTKRDISALDHKIQMISWSDNPLKKLLGIKDLRLLQAVTKMVSKNKTMNVPSCNMDHINKVTRSLYGENALDNIDYAKIHPSYFYRIAMYVVLLYTGLMTIGYWVENTNFMIIISIVMSYMLLTRYLSMKKKKYGYNDEMIVIDGGSYGDKTSVLPIYKIQSVEKNSTPYQRRKGLASLVLHTASGRIGIPYIEQEKALSIRDMLLYKVQKDKRKWM